MSPSIPPEFRASLLGPAGDCPSCGGERIKQYCRTCDEFFLTCRCAPSAHTEHRVYLWTPTGVVASPDFDDLDAFIRRAQNAQAAVDEALAPLGSRMVDEALDRPNSDPEVRALYESMTTDELQLFGRALELDARHGAPHAFVTRRLHLIAEVLRAREPKA